MTIRRKGTWGGARPGTGPKPRIKDAAPLTVRLPAADLARLQSIARRRGVTVSAHVRSILHRSLAHSR